MPLKEKTIISLKRLFSEEFSINQDARQGCHLSPILFNLFINDVLDNYDKYGVYLDSQYCCGGLFADDVVLIDPSAKNLEKLLKRYIDGLI